MAALAAIAPLSTASLEHLVWRGDRLASAATPGLPTGYAPLDAALPGGGWPVGALTELLVPHAGVGELGLLLPLLARVPARRQAVCIAPPGQLYAPALAAAGVPLDRLLVVHAESPAHARWAARQALNSHSCEVVLLWLAAADMGALRRLQLAAEDSATALILIRPANVATQPSPAVLRMALAARSGGLEVRILKRRGPQLAGPLCIDLPWPGSTPRPDHPHLSEALQPARPTAASALRPAASSASSIHALVRPLPARPGPANLHTGTP